MWVEFRRQDQREDTRELLRGMERALQVIDQQTSPEAVAEREQQIDGLLFLADCNQRKAVVDYAEALGTPIEIVGGQCPPD